jgi:hypothetical protein
MRLLLLALCTSLLFGTAAERSAAQAVSDGELRIEWEVSNRFRLFRSEADFRRHVAASVGDGVLAAEQRLARETDGRGWAKDVLDRLCVDRAGKLVETCQRDGERENYLAPQDHRISVRLAGPVPASANCTWTFDDGTPPPRQANAPCGEEMRVRVRYGVPTIAAVGITRPDNTVDSVTTEIRVDDLLIAGMGDSIAAGEGNPDRPVALADIGFCFRRFLGTGLSEYFRPSRAGFRGNQACGDTPGGALASPAGSASSPTNAADEWARQGARWMSAACHRSLYGYQMRTALALAIESPHVAITFLPLACTGATIDAGLFGSQSARECPIGGSCASSVPGQIAQLQEALATARKLDPKRALDLILLTVGANDVKFSGLVADVIITAGVERTLFQQGGLITSVPESQRILDKELPANFTKLRAALKPLVGGSLARVLYVSYGNPALQGEGVSCPGGRDGLDVHPAFTADPARMRSVADFVSNKFLPRLKSLARCEGSGTCREPSTDRMTLVDIHQAAFAERGFCARSTQDPEFDQQCFSPAGESFDPDPASAATAPMACSLRPNEFRPYAPRARWIRTPNDSYFSAMTFPRNMLGPANIHDATWGALSALYGGAIHPTAEGHAAMADAALPAARELLGLKPPPAFTTEPLAPLR